MAITAIVILVTMIMTIELVNRANQMPKDASTVNIEAVDELKNSNDELIEEIKYLKTELQKARGRQTPGEPVISEDPAELRRQVTALRQQLEQPRDVLPDNASIAKSIVKLQSQIQQLHAESTVIYKPSSAANRNAWILVCDENSFAIRPLTGATGGSLLDQKTADQRMDALTQKLENFNPRSDYFLIVLRPSATAYYFDILQAFDGFGIPAGADLIDEDVKVMTATELGEI